MIAAPSQRPVCPDVNVLLNAINPGSVDNTSANALLRLYPLILLPDIVASFVRIATHGRVFERPLNVSDAKEVIDQIIDLPATTVARPSSRRISLMFELCKAFKASGDDVADAFIVAGANDCGARLSTFDKGLRRYGAERVLYLGS